MGKICKNTILKVINIIKYTIASAISDRLLNYKKWYVNLNYSYSM